MRISVGMRQSVGVGNSTGRTLRRRCCTGVLGQDGSVVIAVEVGFGSVPMDVMGFALMTQQVTDGWETLVYAFLRVAAIWLQVDI